MASRVRSRTTLNLDSEFLHEGQEIMGTTQATETIHLALWEVVSRHRRELVLAHDFSDLPLDDIREKPTELSDGPKEPASPPIRTERTHRFRP